MDKSTFYGTHNLSVVVQNDTITQSTVLKYIKKHKIHPDSYLSLPNTNTYVPLVWYFAITHTNERPWIKIVKLLLKHHCDINKQPDTESPNECPVLLTDCHQVFFTLFLKQTPEFDIPQEHLDSKMTSLLTDAKFFRVGMLCKRYPSVSESLKRVSTDATCVSVIKKLILRLVTLSSCLIKTPEKAYDPITNLVHEYFVTINMLVNNGMVPSSDTLQLAVNYYLTDIVKILLTRIVSSNGIVVPKHEDMCEDPNKELLVVCLRHLFNDYNYAMITEALAEHSK